MLVQHTFNIILKFIFEVYFEYNNSVAFDTGKETIASDGWTTYKCKELSVITKCELSGSLFSLSNIIIKSFE